jgi:UDP-N-acetylmuramate dehydrogenase
VTVTDAIDGAVADTLARLGERAQRDVPLGPMTTYRVGGPAAVFVEAGSEADLLALAPAVATGIPILVLGNGSNLLVSDDGFRGLVVHLGESLAAIDLDGTTVNAGGAASLPVVARRTAAAGLTGLEWAVGVPGSVGGGVRMNAGGHGSDIAERLVSARLVDLARGAVEDRPLAAMAYGYRRSSVAVTEVVVRATFALEHGDRDVAEARIADIVKWRREHQPGGANAGSVFTNPPGDAAGRLIEAAGLKGLRRGSAAVSGKHANFIQADPGGRAADVLAVAVEVQRRVADAFGLVMAPELRLIGFDSNPLVEVER